MPGVILKTNMVIPGVDCQKVSNPVEIAENTLEVLGDTVPPSIGGIVFLSGGRRARISALKNHVLTHFKLSAYFLQVKASWKLRSTWMLSTEALQSTARWVWQCKLIFHFHKPLLILPTTCFSIGPMEADFLLWKSASRHRLQGLEW